MLALIRSLLPPLVSLILMMIGSGLFNTFVSIRLEMASVSPEMIGIVTSCLYIGILVGSFKIDRWISKVGHIRAFTILAAVLAAVVLFQGFWINPIYWSFLRFVGGICSAGVFIVIESWLLMQSAPNMRGAVLSIYLAALYGSLSMGQLLIDISDPMGLLPYCITTLLVILSILPITIRKVKEPKIQESACLNLIQLYKISPLGFVGGIISGMILAVTYGLVPVFAKEIGMSLAEIGVFMAILIFGGFSLQWPIGRWADQGNRHRVIQIISFATAFCGLSVVMTSNTWLLYVSAFLFGGFAFTIYPLSMAYACERVKENEIVAATGGFVLSYGMGAVAGPILAPIAMSYLGAIGVFYFLGFIALFLGIVGLKKPSVHLS